MHLETPIAPESFLGRALILKAPIARASHDGSGALVAPFADLQDRGMALDEAFWGLWLLPPGYLVRVPASQAAGRDASLDLTWPRHFIGS